MHWHVQKGGASHYRKAKRRGQRVEVGVAIGADPAVCFAATLPLPEGIDEMLVAGFIRKKPIELVKCETVDVEVPAHAEIVLEGYVDTEELRTEGPFGDHTGYYSLADEYPVFHLTCLTHRKNPIYHTIVVGRPPMEDCHMAAAIETLFLPVMKKQLPEIVDFHLPFEGIFHNLALVSIDKQYPGHARKVMHALWGLGQAMVTKVIVVVDRDVNLRDYSEVAWKALNHIDPERDIEFVLGPSRDPGPRQPPAQIRLQDGRGRHAQVARGGFHPPLARRDRDGLADQGARRPPLGRVRAGLSTLLGAAHRRAIERLLSSQTSCMRP